MLKFKKEIQISVFLNIKKIFYDKLLGVKNGGGTHPEDLCGKEIQHPSLVRMIRKSIQKPFNVGKMSSYDRLVL